MKRPDDPVTPLVTFDNYVIPGTQRQRTRPVAQLRERGGQVNGMVLAISVICVLTFVLGVMATLKFTTPESEIATLPVVAPDSLIGAQAPQGVTRQQAPDLISPPAMPVAQPGASPVLPALQEAVLKGLKPKRTVGKLTKEEMAVRAREAQAIVNRNKLRMLREGVMAGVYTVTANNEDGVNRLVLQTVNAEMTRASMANLLRAAAARGEIEVPAALTTSNGDIDMDTMLFNLIQTSLMENGTPEGMKAAREMSRRAFAASSAKTRKIKGQRVYTVQPGDSLAYLSLQFYGRPNAYLRIFEANREILRSPDLIQIGQRLIIPG